MNNITVIGIDIAKNVMQIHGTNDKGKVLLTKRVTRDKFLTFMANIPRCLVEMESCGGAHYWACELMNLGFEVKLMSPWQVKKFAGHQKNDANDAKACSEAVTREDMEFVSVKTKVQLEIQSIHRIRSHYIKHRTALTNMMRGILLENGIAIAKGQAALVKKLNALLESETNQLLPKTKIIFQDLYDDLKQLTAKVDQFDQRIEQLAKEDSCCQKIRTLPGIGPITATALIAKIGNGSEFHKGRELSAYLGIVPKQYSSGEAQRLGKISKHGDRYLRQLLIHGGRSAIQGALRKNKITKCFEKQDIHSQWMRSLVERVGRNKACVAVANKNARMIVALLKNQTSFQPTLAH
jgi:transposase